MAQAGSMTLSDTTPVSDKACEIVLPYAYGSVQRSVTRVVVSLTDKVQQSGNGEGE